MMPDEEKHRLAHPNEAALRVWHCHLEMIYTAAFAIRMSSALSALLSFKAWMQPDYLNTLLWLETHWGKHMHALAFCCKQFYFNGKQKEWSHFSPPLMLMSGFQAWLPGWREPWYFHRTEPLSSFNVFPLMRREKTSDSFPSCPDVSMH